METVIARPLPSSARASLAARLYGGLVFAFAVAALGVWFLAYPLDRVVAAALLGACGVLVVARPASWLILMPALWPVVDLAPWTGHIHFTESDALALTILAALGLREAVAPPAAILAGRAPVKLTVAALVLFGVLAASVAISGLRGLLPLPPLDGSALLGYNSNLNALRIGKGFVLAFLLIPFLHLAIRRGGEAALDRLAIGLTLGLATCALAALWERLAFTSLTDFATDYRTTALFWEMHVGGAALDAWLILTFPFALLALRRAPGALGKGLALVAVGVGSYALFTTFSRIVYAALFVALPLLGGLSLLGPAATTDAPRHRPLVLLALTVTALLGCALTFPEGGYRGLIAFVGLALLAWPAGGALAGMRIGQVLGGLLAATVLLGTSVVAMLWVPKGVYLIYALSWVTTAVVLLAGARGKAAKASPAIVALICWMAGNVVLVSAFWSEPTRYSGSAVAAGLILALLAWQALGRKPLWIPQTHDLAGVAAVLALGAMLVTTLDSYYMGSRLSGIGGDVDTRFQHVENSLGLMHGGTDTLFGIGLGHYPEAYFWTVDKPGVPGSLSLHQDANGHYLRLGGPKGQRPGDEVLTLSQRLPVATATRLHYRLKVRSDKDTQFAMSICRKNLLYPDGCTLVGIPVKGRAGWQTTEGVTPEAAPGPGWPPRPAVFSVSIGDQTYVDLDNFEVFDGGMQPLLRNGDFERGADFWFFTSDRDHLPWHAKNLFVHSYVEQGLLGLAAILLALTTAGLRLLRHPVRLQPHAPTLLAALAGVATVGLVDSVVDVPRITLFLVLLLWLALTLRRPPAG